MQLIQSQSVERFVVKLKNIPSSSGFSLHPKQETAGFHLNFILSLLDVDDAGD